MLTICTDTLPQSCLSYVAFRLACIETLELMDFSRRVPAENREPFGFLTQVPFLRDVAPQVQLSLLAETWSKHLAKEEFHANLVDEAVVYAVCETSARMVEKLPELVQPFLENGPLNAKISIDHQLASELRALHLQLSNEGDFLLISQFEDLPPEESHEFKQQFHLNDFYIQPMFDVLGRWHPDRDLSRNLTGLLSEAEVKDLERVIGAFAPLAARK
ncbi:MAG: hypothetical protein U0903_07280 [Planctomycetales bacterium]